MIPNEIKQVRDYLATNKPFSLPSDGDSRGNSAAFGRTVSLGLADIPWGSFVVTSPYSKKSHNRFWYNLKIGNYFCNIKVSALGNTADNTSAKMATFYLLTGKYHNSPPGLNVPTQNAPFFKMMYENELPNETRDYYYIVIDKKDLSNVFVVNLRGLCRVQPNSENPPFQCNWNKNRTPVERSWQQAKDFLLSNWAKSIENKTKAWESMYKYYPKYSNKNS